MPTALLPALAVGRRALPRPAYEVLGASLADAGLSRLRGCLRGARRPSVLEVTEHVAIEDYPAFRAAGGRHES